MIKSILLPIDMQHESSWVRALPMARSILQPGGELHLLGVVHDVGNAWVASYLPKGYEKKALEDLKAALQAFARDKLPDLPGVQTHVGYGHVAETIIAMAARVHADLIVMASQSPDELRTFRIASQGDRVARHAPTSVLLVR